MALQEKSTDRVIRAMTQDGQFRVIVATIDATCAEAASRQNAPEGLMPRQAQLICAGVLIRETMQPGNRVQIILKDAEGHRLVADSLPDGKNRSIVNPGDSEIESGLAKKGLFQVNYTLRNGHLHQGVVAVEDTSDVSAAIMRYLKDSEQIAAFVCIETRARDDQNPAVGGFVVQVTPEATREGLAAMTDHLEKLSQQPSWLEGDALEPEELVSVLLKGHEFAMLSESELSFGCTCSVERMLLGLATLPDTDIAEMLGEGQAIEVSCDACGQCYDISTEQLAELLGARTAGASDPGVLPN